MHIGDSDQGLFGQTFGFPWFLVYHVETIIFVKGTMVVSLLVSEIFTKNLF